MNLKAILNFLENKFEDFNTWATRGDVNLDTSIFNIEILIILYVLVMFFIPWVVLMKKDFKRLARISFVYNLKFLEKKIRTPYSLCMLSWFLGILFFLPYLLLVRFIELIVFKVFFL